MSRGLRVISNRFEWRNAGNNVFGVVGSPVSAPTPFSGKPNGYVRILEGYGSGLFYRDRNGQVRRFQGVFLETREEFPVGAIWVHNNSFFYSLSSADPQDADVYEVIDGYPPTGQMPLPDISNIQDVGGGISFDIEQDFYSLLNGFEVMHSYDGSVWDFGNFNLGSESVSGDTVTYTNNSYFLGPADPDPAVFRIRALSNEVQNSNWNVFYDQR
jgi:hypothetical protein